MRLIHGDCKQELKKLEDNSVDAVVTDPPYGLVFMGKRWDADTPGQEVWEECLRVLKPGGHLLSFGGSRTYHRMACAIEDAGFEIRDMIAWVYGSGFPKSLNIGKAVDKLQGNERESKIVKGKVFTGSNNNINGETGEYKVTKGTSEWEGWGTALKPAHEPIVLARKPLSEKTIAENCLKWGTGGINIDESRVGYTSEYDKKHQDDIQKGQVNADNGKFFGGKGQSVSSGNLQGRFPANLIHDGSEEVRECFPDSKAGSYKGEGSKSGGIWSESTGKPAGMEYGDSGNASRYFKSIKYCAKASKKERNRGCEGLEEKPRANINKMMGEAGNFKTGSGNDRTTKFTNNHPTVKPLALMKYLINLISREGQTVLDPFMGSGTTGMACKELGREFIGIEKEPEYIEIAKRRIGIINKGCMEGL